MKTANKQKSYSTRERVKRLKITVEEAVKFGFEPKVIKNFKDQLKEQEEILQKDLEKRKARLKI